MAHRPSFVAVSLTPSNDADCRVRLIRLLNDSKLLSGRPATAPLRPGQDLDLRMVTSHNGHITSHTYQVGDRVRIFMGPLHCRSGPFNLINQGETGIASAKAGGDPTCRPALTCHGLGPEHNSLSALRLPFPDRVVETLHDILGNAERKHVMQRVRWLFLYRVSMEGKWRPS